MVIKKTAKITSIIIFIIIATFILLFLIRLINPSEIDDISPNVHCSKSAMEKSDVFWVIPYFNNESIANNKEWCEKILALNKSLGLHGIYHEYQEFKTTRNDEYLKIGIDAFEECFGFSPEKFKPPQLEINKENKNLIKENNLKLKRYFNQVTRKVYHCNDKPEKLSNDFINLF